MALMSQEEKDERGRRPLKLNLLPSNGDIPAVTSVQGLAAISKQCEDERRRRRLGGERERYKKGFFCGGKKRDEARGERQGGVCGGPILSVSFCECVGVAEWPSPVEDGKGGGRRKKPLPLFFHWRQHCRMSPHEKEEKGPSSYHLDGRKAKRPPRPLLPLPPSPPPRPSTKGTRFGSFAPPLPHPGLAASKPARNRERHGGD